MRGARFVLPAVLAAFLAAPAAGQTGVLDSLRARAHSDPDAVRGALDSLLAPGAVAAEGISLPEAELLRASLTEDGKTYEGELRALLDRDLPPPVEAGIRLELGKIAYTRGELSIALQEFRKARETGSAGPGALWEGITAFALGDGEAARSALAPVIAGGDSSLQARALLVLGDTYRVGENWGEARGAYHRLREDAGVGGSWWSTAAFREAECLDRMGETAEAVALWRELVATKPGAYEAPLALARIRALGVPVPAPLPTEGGIAVQVGAFAKSENAEELAARIRERGFTPVRVTAGEDGLHRVLVGRFEDREEAEALADSLGAALGLGYSIAVDGK
jgi:tetratricopeptide (TPR) repeat protein